MESGRVPIAWLEATSLRERKKESTSGEGEEMSRAQG